MHRLTKLILIKFWLSGRKKDNVHKEQVMKRKDGQSGIKLWSFWIMSYEGISINL